MSLFQDAAHFAKCAQKLFPICNSTASDKLFYNGRITLMKWDKYPKKTNTCEKYMRLEKYLL